MKHHLMLGAAASALLFVTAGQALAADKTADAAAPAAATAAPDTEVDTVIILGQGQSRQVQTVSDAQVALQAAGSSPLKAVEKLPGVSFQSADAFGAYEWSTRISIRGFDQSRLGFTLDGVPLGDMSYGNYNGLHISRAIASEDIGSVELAQGAGSLSTASTSNLGGTLQFFSRRPTDDFGVQTDVTGGSDNMYRVFGRLDTGAIEALGGLKAYVSVADQKADKWKGGSKQKQRQYDGKVELPLGETGTLTAFWDHSERREQDYQDMSFDMIKRLGSNWDNFQPDWAKAIGVATVLNNPANYAGATPLLSGGYWTGVGTNPYAAYGVATPDDAYYAGAGIRDDDVYAVTLKEKLGALHFDLTGYGHQNQGQGLWYTPYTVSPGYGTPGSNAAPLSIRTTEYDIDRKGLIGNATYDIGDHQIGAGFWTEDNDFHQARRFYAETLDHPSRNPLDFQSNPFLTSWDYKFNTKTTTGYLQDVWAINEALKVNFGFKAMKVENKVSTVAGNPMNGKIESKESFLPQVGVVYKLDNGVEFFGGYTKNMAAFVSAATSGPFASQNQTVVDYVSKNLQPETSKTFEGGARYHNSRFQGVVALYHVKFDNRLDSASTAPPILGLPAVLSNVGSVTTKGVEVAGEYRLTDTWSVYGAYTYNDSKYDDDVPGAGGLVAMHTKGKDVVFTPKNLVKAELKYDNGGFYSRLGVSYVGSRWYTFENNGGDVDSYTVADLTVGYRFQGAQGSLLHNLEIQGNITNLTDEDYISTVGSGGPAKADPSGTAMTLLPGAPRQAYVTIKKRF